MLKKELLLSVLFLLNSFSVIAGEIQSYDDFDQFSDQFESVEIYPQDTSNSGTTDDDFFYQLEVGEVTIEFEGPANYSNDFPEPGIIVLSKGVPWTLTPDPQGLNGGLGFYIYQGPPVDITVIDNDGDRLEIEGFSNNFGADGSVFLGFTSTAGIEQIQIADAGAITNVSEIALAPEELPAEPSEPPVAEKPPQAIPTTTLPWLAMSCFALILASWRYIRRS